MALTIASRCLLQSQATAVPNILPHAAGLMAKVFPLECADVKQRDYLSKLKYMVGEFSRGGKKGRVMKVEAEDKSCLKSPLRILLAEGKIELEPIPPSTEHMISDDCLSPAHDPDVEVDSEPRQSNAAPAASSNDGERPQAPPPFLTREEFEEQKKKEAELRFAARGSRSLKEFIRKPASVVAAGESEASDESNDEEPAAVPQQKKAKMASEPQMKSKQYKKRVMEDSSDDDIPPAGI